MTIPVDAREVLLHLNAMGFHNITGEQLKEFMKDLKSLIKYDSQQKRQDSGKERDFSKQDLYSKLHATATVSFRAKCKPTKHEYVPKISDKPYHVLETFETGSRNPKKHIYPQHLTVGTKSSGRGSSRVYDQYSVTSTSESCSESGSDNSIDVGIRVDAVMKPSTRHGDTKHAPSKGAASSKDSQKTKTFIRPRCATLPVHKSDPVSLFHAYKAEWDKNKLKIPIENKHAELRWAIREKMLGEQPVKVMPCAKFNMASKKLAR